MALCCVQALSALHMETLQVSIYIWWQCFCCWQRAQSKTLCVQTDRADTWLSGASQQESHQFNFPSSSVWVFSRFLQFPPHSPKTCMFSSIGDCVWPPEPYSTTGYTADKMMDGWIIQDSSKMPFHNHNQLWFDYINNKWTGAELVPEDRQRNTILGNAFHQPLEPDFNILHFSWFSWQKENCE